MISHSGDCVLAESARDIQSMCASVRLSLQSLERARNRVRDCVARPRRTDEH